MCSVSRLQTSAQTDLKMKTGDTHSGFQDFFLQPIIKDRSNKMFLYYNDVYKCDIWFERSLDLKNVCLKMYNYFQMFKVDFHDFSYKSTNQCLWPIFVHTPTCLVSKTCSISFLCHLWMMSITYVMYGNWANPWW